MKDDFSIIFMGTPEFAVTILDKLHSDGLNIKAVVTVPDKPSGRGQKINKSAVKKYAEEKKLKTLQPEKLKSPEFIQQLEELSADLFVVVAFRMLPEVVWTMPKSGTINLHGSLLPNYRGAAPINWAIINGDKSTGVTTFFIEKEIDTGKIIEQEEIKIGLNETVGELYERLMHLGADLMSSTVMKIKKGKVISIPQNEFSEEVLKPAPKIFKSDCEIDFTMKVLEVHDFCRGLDPYPAAWCKLEDIDKGEVKTYKVFKTRITDLTIKDKDVLIKDPEGILIPCKDFYLRILEIQPEGKRRMDYKSFLAGNSIENLVIKHN